MWEKLVIIKVLCNYKTCTGFIGWHQLLSCSYGFAAEEELVHYFKHVADCKMSCISQLSIVVDYVSDLLFTHYIKMIQLVQRDRFIKVIRRRAYMSLRIPGQTKMCILLSPRLR